MLALFAGKHVLCEKAFTTNAGQTKKLIQAAKEKKLFLMEAVWTRFFPLSIKIREMIRMGELGDVHRVIADNSLYVLHEAFSLDRMISDKNSFLGIERLIPTGLS